MIHTGRLPVLIARLQGNDEWHSQCLLACVYRDKKKKNSTYLDIIAYTTLNSSLYPYIFYPYRYSYVQYIFLNNILVKNLFSQTHSFPEFQNSGAVGSFSEAVMYGYFGWEKSVHGMNVNRSQASEQFIVRTCLCLIDFQNTFVLIDTNETSFPGVLNYIRVWSRYFEQLAALPIARLPIARNTMTTPTSWIKLKTFEKIWKMLDYDYEQMTRSWIICN